METARVFKLVLICALGAITACNGEEVLPTDAGVDGPVIPDGGSTTAVAGSAGGTFTFYGGKVTLEVPAGALSKDTTIRVLALVSYPQDSRLVPGTVYDLLPDGTSFNKAVKLSITYEQASVPSGLAEGDLRIHKVVSGSWKLISGGGVEAKANVAWANLKGFSKYGVAGPTPATVDGMVDAGVDTAVPVDGAKPDVPKDGAKPDAPKDGAKPDSPKSDLPPPDLPLPDLPKPPDMPVSPDMPLPPDMPVPPDAPKLDLPVKQDMPAPPDMLKPDAGIICGTNSSCGTIVYVSTSSHNGNFGGRGGLDSFCSSKMPAGLSCANVHAMITVSASDEIRDMPANYGYTAGKPLYWYSGTTKKYTTFASSWIDALKGNILVDRKTGTGQDKYVWTGSSNIGAALDTTRYHCSGWKSSSYGPAWKISGFSMNGNVHSAAVGMPDSSKSWLYSSSSMAKKKAYGPSTCCFNGSSKCPDTCPTSATAFGDVLLCGSSAPVMCACEPAVSCMGKLTNKCLISGTCYKAGAKHPGGCATCDPSTSTTKWTVTGSTHCLISNACRASGDKDLGGCATCNPSKSKTAYTLLLGKCRIDGTCYGSGAKHPKGCGSCDPAKSGTTWTPAGNNCVIDHACYASGAKHSAGCGTCDPSKSQTNWTVSGNKCLIGSTCRASGAKESGGCGVCDPAKSKTAWSRSSGCLVAHAWSKKLLSSIRGMAVDGNGNIYITGGFITSVNFGGSTLTSKYADMDIYLASFTPSGKHRWSKAFGSKGTDEGHDVAVDGNGNVTITGTFAANISFGGGKISDPGGKSDIFVASFTTHGKHRWSKGFGRSDTMTDETSIAADGAGNTYITGIFEVYINFGGGHPSFDLKSKAKFWDMFLASFDSGGKHRWSKIFANPSTISVCSSDVVVDNSGNTYVTGWFSGSVSFGGTVITSSGSEDVHLASFTSAGTHRWSKKLGGKAHDRGAAVAVDNNASVFATGYIGTSPDLGGGVEKTYGVVDIFVAAYTTSGVYRWSRVFGSSLGDNGEGISADSMGNVYLTGYFLNSVDFGGGKLSTKGTHEMFIVSLDPAGKHRWSRAHGSTWSDSGHLVENDDKGNIYLGSQFAQTVDLGGGSFAFGKGSYALFKLSP